MHSRKVKKLGSLIFSNLEFFFFSTSGMMNIVQISKFVYQNNAIKQKWETFSFKRLLCLMSRFKLYNSMFVCRNLIYL